MGNDAVKMERLEAHRAVIGDGFEIRRAVPNRHCRMIGAWCFLDHAGPVRYKPGKGLNIGPHPHIGLQTFTWMIEGEVLHRDSLGCVQLIRPGQVNLMTAGRGISHSEESPLGRTGRFHSTQLWIALPDAERHREPDFHHYPALPVIDRGGFRVTVLAGTCDGEISPARVYTPLVGLDIATRGRAQCTLPLNPSFEHAALTLEGAPDLNGDLLEPGTLLYLGTGHGSLELNSPAKSRVLVIGGVPFGEEILLWWNFVARTPAEMEAARRDWIEGERFGQVHGASGKPLIAPELKGLNPGGARK
ncbi:MAG: pirin family protein [Gammaproteobacteria bacterium]|nr:pirin family protein [Gammaproteobacteria bacterium]